MDVNTEVPTTSPAAFKGEMPPFAAGATLTFVFDGFDFGDFFGLVGFTGVFAGLSAVKLSALFDVDAAVLAFLRFRSFNSRSSCWAAFTFA